ncbi:hypothetical protein, partial [Pseudomonas aeruginosa]|uniref:hypothetical protein n=1 Tax=Pseudomonas aeruginosa TaxID=287 RepID=UPI001E465312
RSALNDSEAVSVRPAPDGVSSVICATPFEGGHQVEPFLSQLSPQYPQFSINIQRGLVEGDLSLSLVSSPARFWLQIPFPRHQPSPLPRDRVDAQASTLADLIREQMAKRPPVSERFKALQAQRNRLSQEATER